MEILGSIRPKVNRGVDWATSKADHFFDHPEDRGEIEEILKRHSLDADAIDAQAFALRTDKLERIDRMLASAQTRRGKALDMIDSRKYAKTLRQASDAIIEEQGQETSITPMTLASNTASPDARDHTQS